MTLEEAQEHCNREDTHGEGWFDGYTKVGRKVTGSYLKPKEAREDELEFEGDPIPNPECPICGGPGIPLGTMGKREYFRCQDCGMEFSHVNDLIYRMEGSRRAMKGGRAEGMSPSNFDPIQVAMGQKVEMEHTDDPQIALQISMDHLRENESYYTMLAEMEAQHKKDVEMATEFIDSEDRKDNLRQGDGDIVVDMKGTEGNEL